MATNKNSCTNRIVPLDRDKWAGHKFAKFSYTSDSYYDVEIACNDGNFHVSFVKKPFDPPFKMNPDEYDVLFQPWWEDAKAWGTLEDEKLIAVIETAVGWGNRLRVTELWVDDAYHRQGIATALMDIAVVRAKEENRRGIVLEAQSCNSGAIAFYLAYGFTLIGFDSCAYQNDDLQRKEVRIEFGMNLM